MISIIKYNLDILELYSILMKEIMFTDTNWIFTNNKYGWDQDWIMSEIIRSLNEVDFCRYTSGKNLQQETYTIFNLFVSFCLIKKHELYGRLRFMRPK